MVYGLYQLIPISSQLAFFKAIFLFLLTTNANPLLELWLACCVRLSRLLNPSHLPITIASLNEDNCLAVSLALFLDILCYIEESFLLPDKNKVKEEDPEGDVTHGPF